MYAAAILLKTNATLIDQIELTLLTLAASNVKLNGLKSSKIPASQWKPLSKLNGLLKMIFITMTINSGIVDICHEGKSLSFFCLGATSPP